MCSVCCIEFHGVYLRIFIFKGYVLMEIRGAEAESTIRNYFVFEINIRMGMAVLTDGVLSTAQSQCLTAYSSISLKRLILI
jgi:hypothetical protein